MRLAALALPLLLSASPLDAALKHGDAAPPIEISKWVKGETVDLRGARDKKVVVLEFWATWCGPCRTSIPHLTELQKKHKKDLVIIGVTKADPNNSLDKVESFVKEWGDKMDYTVAFDEPGKTYDAYMTAMNQLGIPTAFIIDKAGKLAWLGHPMTMDKPLEEILSGKFDIPKAAREYEQRMRMQELQQTFFEKLQGDDIAAAGKDAEKIIELSKDDADTLNNLAWVLLTHPAAKGKFNKAALAAATRCDELTKGESWMFLDTLGLATFEAGKKPEAIKIQRKAIELAEKAKAPEQAIAEFKQRLDLFEKGSEKNSEKSSEKQ